MTISGYEKRIARGRTPGDEGCYPPKVQGIIRTPGNEHRVTAGDLSSVRTGKEPKSSNGATRPCAMNCGMPAARDDVFCKNCRSEAGQH